MTRDEAQRAEPESEHYRPLSMSTITLCDRCGNQTMRRILTPDDGGIVVDTYAVLEFLFIHYREHDLPTIRKMITDGSLEDAVLAWGEDLDPVIIDEGVSYFTTIKKS